MHYSSQQSNAGEVNGNVNSNMNANMNSNMNSNMNGNMNGNNLNGLSGGVYLLHDPLPVYPLRIRRSPVSLVELQSIL